MNIDELKLELAAVRAERDNLVAWKQSRLTVEAWWQRVDEFVRNHPEAKVGDSVCELTLKWLKERDEVVDALELALNVRGTSEDTIEVLHKMENALRSSRKYDPRR